MLRPLLAHGSLLALFAALGCSLTDPDVPVEENDDGEMDTGDTGAMTMPPEACPGVTDPECTTDAPCGLDEECILCECRPKGTACEEVPGAECTSDGDCPDIAACIDCLCSSICSADEACQFDSDCGENEYCVEPGEENDGCFCEPVACGEPDACFGDGECGEGETCVDCECVTACECSGDEECTAPQTCDGCNCMEPESTCATGETMAPNSDAITISGLEINGQISGSPADCPVLLCSFTVTNNTPDYITFGLMESLPEDPIAPMPIVSAVAGGASQEFEVWANDCETPTTLDRTLFIYDEGNGINLGEVDLIWRTLLM